MSDEITFDDFAKVDVRVGRITAVDDFPEARKPAWKLTIDFGPEIGEKRSSAQITNYAREGADILVTAPRSPAIVRADDVGHNGGLKIALRSFRFGTERP